MGEQREIKEERRKIKQIDQRDENGNLEYAIIPNYKEHNPFMTKNELFFYKWLGKAVDNINKNTSVNYTIFAQVALNRLIDVNNLRESNLRKDISSNRSIDFCIYDIKSEIVKCCIELDDKTHEDPERIERDKIIDKMFENTSIKLIHQAAQNFYNPDEIEKKIIG